MTKTETDNQEQEPAIVLLRRYDKLKAELMQVERELGKACAAYGRSIGIWGLTRDHLRIQLNHREQGVSHGNPRPTAGNAKLRT